MASSDIVQYRSPLRTRRRGADGGLPRGLRRLDRAADLRDVRVARSRTCWRPSSCRQSATGAASASVLRLQPDLQALSQPVRRPELRRSTSSTASLAALRLGAGLGRAGLDVRLRAVADRVPRQEGPVLLDHLDPHGAGGGGDGPALRHLPLGRPGRHAARPDPGLHHLQPAVRDLDPQGLLRQRALRDRGGGDVRRLHPLPGAFARSCRWWRRASAPSWSCACCSPGTTSCSPRSSAPAAPRRCRSRPRELVQPQNIQWGSIMAAGVVTTLPMMFLGLLIRRYLVTGLTMGAVRE